MAIIVLLISHSMSNLSNLNTSCIASIKDEARTALQSILFECYKNIETVKIYKSADEIVTIQDPCFDSNWGKGLIQEVNKEYFQDSINLPAIVVYDSPKDLKQFIQDEDELSHVRMKNTPQTIRLKFKPNIEQDLYNMGLSEDLFALSGADLSSILDEALSNIINAKKITFLDEEYKPMSNIIKTMFFGQPIWYQIILKRVN